MTGAITTIFKGTTLGLVEGPHLYKINGWYYLVTAEGGTFHDHAVTVARSKVLQGPYEVMPENPLITSARNPLLRLQSSGHGSLVQNKDGSWLLAHLCRRSLENGRSILGRETSLQPVEWIDGWPRLANGGHEPLDKVELPTLASHPWPVIPVRDDFDQSQLAIHWQSLRVKLDENFMSLSARKGHLRLYGRESIASLFEQSLVARRQQSFCIEAATCLEFSPNNIQQMAGLVAFYNTDSFYYFFLTWAEHSKRCLGLMKCEKGKTSYVIEKEFPLDHWDKVCLKFNIDHERIRFHYSQDAKQWTTISWEQDASILCDEHSLPMGFTGNFVGVACQDLSGARKHADFDWFEYRELDK